MTIALSCNRTVTDLAGCQTFLEDGYLPHEAPQE